VKAAEDRLVVLEQLAVTQPKTREMAGILSRLAVDASALILMAEADEMVERASNNLPDVKLLRAEYVNVRDLLTYDYLVIPQNALAVIETILG
jgi:large subunit ribosomal protein L4